MEKLGTIIVDDCRICLDMLTEICEGDSHVSVKGSFVNPVDAFIFAKTNRIDLAILDIVMPEMSGIELGRQLRKINPDIIVLYITGREECCVDAVKDHADFIIFKPFDMKVIGKSLQRASLFAEGNRERKLEVKTYGRFDVFYDGNTIHLSNAKAKELFALCIDHLGGEVTMEEAVDKLWPDKPFDERVKRLYRKAVANLRSTLEQYTDKEIFHNSRGSCYVRLEYIKCDYFDHVNAYMNNKNHGIAEDKFFENYMIDYPWTEETVAKYYFS